MLPVLCFALVLFWMLWLKKHQHTTDRKSINQLNYTLIDNHMHWIQALRYMEDFFTNWNICRNAEGYKRNQIICEAINVIETAILLLSLKASEENTWRPSGDECKNYAGVPLKEVKWTFIYFLFSLIWKVSSLFLSCQIKWKKWQHFNIICQTEKIFKQQFRISCWLF